MNNRCIISTICLLQASMAVTPHTGAADLVLENISIVDVRTGQTLPPGMIRITGDRIASVSERANNQPAGTSHTLDGSGLYAIPGLWDMHTHAHGEKDFATMVAYGVTTTRIMDGSSQYLKWRQEIDDGEIVGPRLLVSSPILFGPPFAGQGRIIRNHAEAAAAVRELKNAGYDFIKTHQTLTPEIHQSIALEAKNMGIPVIGHIPATRGAISAIDAGHQCVEHLDGYCEDLLPDTSPIAPGFDARSRNLAWHYADPARIERLATATQERGAWNCPTLSIRVGLLDRDGVEAYLGRDGAQLLPKDRLSTMLDRSRQTWWDDMSETNFENAIDGYAKKYALVRSLQNAGAGILAGSDLDPWGFSLHYELEQLVAAGLTPQEALAAATISASEYTNSSSHLGEVKEGYVADLVILEENPLTDIRNSRRIVAVILKGRLFKREDLENLLSKSTVGR